MQARSGFFEVEPTEKDGADVQVKVRLEVEEHIERLVRCTHLLMEPDSNLAAR